MYSMAQLTDATKEGNLDVVKVLVRAGHPVNGFDPRDGSTALYWAACMGDLRICDWLIQNGAEVNLPHRKKGSLPLHAASDRGHIDCVYRLLRAGAHINQSTPMNQDTPLHLACYRGYFNLCRLLIAEGANLTAVNRQGNTPREEALCKGHTKVFEFVHRSAKNQTGRNRVTSTGFVRDAEDLSVFQSSVRESTREHAHSAPLLINTSQLQNLTAQNIDSPDSEFRNQQTVKPNYAVGGVERADCRCCCCASNNAGASYTPNGIPGHLQTTEMYVAKLTQELRKKDDQIRHLEAVNEQLRIYSILFDKKHSEAQRLAAENEKLRSQLSGRMTSNYSTFVTFDSSLGTFDTSQPQMNGYSLNLDGIQRDADEVWSSDDSCSLVSRTASQTEPLEPKSDQ